MGASAPPVITGSVSNISRTRFADVMARDTDWNIIVTIETDAPLYEGVVYTASVVTDTYRPIEMVFR